MTKGEFVSNIYSVLNLDTKDTRISRRQVLSIGEMYLKTFLAQRLDELKLENQYSLISNISCFEMEPIDYITCGYVDLKECRTMVRSVKKLPETVKGNTGYAIFSVLTLDDSKEYVQVTRTEIKGLMKRRFVRDKSKFYIIEDDHLIIVNDDPEMVKIQMIALNEEEVEEACEACNDDINTTNSRKCISLWEEEFKCPDKLLMGVQNATVQALSMKVQIPVDENPNMDSNQKSQTVM